MKCEVVWVVGNLGCHLERLSSSRERCGKEGSLQNAEGLTAGSAVCQAAGYYLWPGQESPVVTSLLTRSYALTPQVVKNLLCSGTCPPGHTGHQEKTRHQSSEEIKNWSIREEANPRRHKQNTFLSSENTHFYFHYIRMSVEYWAFTREGNVYLPFNSQTEELWNGRALFTKI